ncbi:M16 family metallopeptidase [Flavobacterium procerum]|uniref:M16 family metallopeptidase n=1 Tax=Flavobacterium procerum TaxID=1455569 RepID=A0ABV6BS26_9FLAO
MKLVQSKFLLFTLLCFGAKSNAQFSTTIPLSEEVVSGNLRNGMKYYVLHNEWPKDRVSFYFAQNVGAILEEDNQNGLAHFLEHMAFNGTQNFEGKGIIDMLEKNGVRFGSDINAYTSQDQTVYNLSNVPAKKQLIDSCLLVLHDWSGFLSLKDAEIDAERGVIREEWRARNTADFRLRTQTNKVLFKGSKYSDRDVIGDMNIIDNFKYQDLKDYYEKWYRPDLQAVIVVGDVDVKEVEQKIIKLFSDIEMPQNPAKRYYVQIPDNKEMQYVLAKDKEAKQTKITLYYKKNPDKEKNIQSFKKDLINSLCVNMLNRRFQQFIQSGETASISLGAGTTEITRSTNSFSLVMIPKNGKTKKGFEELMTETERAVRFGYTQKELDRSKKNTLSSFENLLRNKDKIKSDSFAGQLAEYFFSAEPFMSLQKQYDEVKAALEVIRLADVNLAVKELYHSENQFLMVTGPDRTDISYPMEGDFTKIMSDVQKMNLEKYKETDIERPLVEDKLKAVSVSKEFAVNGISGAKEYTLSNGAKIILYPTGLAKDEILFSAFSKGGSSLIKTEDIPSSQVAVNLVEKSGLGSFRSSDLSDKLNGRIVRIQPYINEISEGFQGSTNQKDMETMLQLLYLYFEHPRRDKESYSRIISQYKNTVDNSINNNIKVFQDTVSQLNSNRNKRVPLFNQDFINRIEFEKAAICYKERFQNAADFTFIFVGNLPQDALELIKKYIGSISSVPNKEENYIDHHIEPAAGISKQFLIRDMDVPKATVYLRYSYKSSYTLKDGLSAYILSELLSKKYLELIREEQGGSYGVDVFSSVNRLPENNYIMTVSFECDPEKEEKLTPVIYKQIELIQKELADPPTIQSIKSSLLKTRSEKVLSNNFWISSLQNMKLFNENFKDDNAYKTTLEEITTQDIRSFAEKFFNHTKSVQVIMKSKP